MAKIHIIKITYNNQAIPQIILQILYAISFLCTIKPILLSNKLIKVIGIVNIGITPIRSMKYLFCEPSPFGNISIAVKKVAIKLDRINMTIQTNMIAGLSSFLQISFI